MCLSNAESMDWIVWWRWLPRGNVVHDFMNTSSQSRTVHERFWKSSWAWFMNFWTWTVLKTCSWTVYELLLNISKFMNSSSSNHKYLVMNISCTSISNDFSETDFKDPSWIIHEFLCARCFIHIFESNIEMFSIQIL